MTISGNLFVKWLPSWLLLCCLFGCSTDFKTITPYKETMVIYGLLNPNDAVQYIRISKAFLGEGNALIMAKQPDSIYYGNILDVKLERFKNGDLTNTYVYSKLPLDSVPKDDCAFVTPYQAIYAGSMDISDATNATGITYQLTVKNRQSGVIATASTTSIYNFAIPAFGITTDIFAQPIDKYFFSLLPTDQAKIYNMTMKVSYTDSNMVSHFLFDWNLDDQTNTEGNTSALPFSFFKSYLFTLDSIAAQGLPRDTAKRNIFAVDLYVSAATADLYTYMQVTEPCNSIVQDRPQFTNVHNGVGLFTCRNLRVRRLPLSASTIARLDSYFQ